jgi:hypothetical protein
LVRLAVRIPKIVIPNTASMGLQSTPVDNKTEFARSGSCDHCQSS